MKNDLYYLASPYNHKSSTVKMRRYQTICVIAAQLLSKGKAVFSPIAHAYGITRYGNIQDDFASWEMLDCAILTRCTHFVIVKIYGWEMSQGIKKEYEKAMSLDLPILTWDNGILKPISDVDRELLTLYKEPKENV